LEGNLKHEFFFFTSPPPPPPILPSAVSTKTSHFKEMRPILIRLQIKLTCCERCNPYGRSVISAQKKKHIRYNDCLITGRPINPDSNPTRCKTFFLTPKTPGTAVAQWLRCCATNRKVAGSIPDGVIGIFHWHNPCDRTMALSSTQPLIEMSTRNISWG